MNEVKRKIRVSPKIRPAVARKPKITVKTKVNPTDYGQTIRFADIEKGGIKDRTWINYINSVTRFYTSLGLPDKNVFYWEHLSKPESINQIIAEILHNYHIKDGNALAGKLSPFKSLIYRMDNNVSLDAIQTWSNAIMNCRSNYGDILKELNVTPVESAPVKVTTDNWETVRDKLHEMSLKKSLDSRVRVLATVYKYGYVFRMSTVFRTYIHNLQEEDRTHYNHLDLYANKWTIVEDGTVKLAFSIPSNMARELLQLTQGFMFNRGWLLPQRRGTPYAPEASLSSFSSWTKAGLSNYRTYRKIYLAWLKSNLDEADYEVFIKVLDTSIAFDHIDYTPPYPFPEVAPVVSADNAILSAEQLQQKGGGIERRV